MKILSKNKRRRKNELQVKYKEMRDEKTSTVISLRLKQYQNLIQIEEQMQYIQTQ
ncbi:unnamed protein product [Paramecium octaurelia]|uniref:Uncharacterized protein n=1 Tax=Paramecium octaurelia TaxID=43137 RepID=A0A8S1X326_PAROT|nr:unnamed protein product [Paramecium octaurelia]